MMRHRFKGARLNAVLWLAAWFAMALTPFSMAAESAKKEEDKESPMSFFNGEPAGMVYPTVSPLLVNASARDYQSLNGKWNITIDESGLGWNVITKHDYLDEGGVYPQTGMRLIERSFDSSNQLTVPGDWNSQRPELDRYRSRILYHKQVDMAPENDKRYFMHFGGANYTTDLFVNDKLVGRHVGGYTSFNFDITDFIKEGTNTLIVRVDAHLDDSTIPTMRTSDFWKYGGLIGDVGIITESATFISQYHVYLNDLDSREIKGWVQLEGDNVANRQVELDIEGADVNLTATTNAAGRAEFLTNAKKLELWSPKSPKLYDVELSLASKVIEDRIGFRTVTTKGTEILLNGKPMNIRGISMHQETIRHPGISTSRKDVKAQFKLVKELNANYVRLAHYTHNEHTVKLADEMGLMLWSEVPIVSMIDWTNPDTLAKAKAQVSENVVRDMNRASVVFWSVSNESFPQTQARLDFLTELATLARSLDESGRPIASALIGDVQEEFKDVGKYLFAYMLSMPDLDPALKQRLVYTAKAMAKKSGGSADSSDQALPEVMNIVNHDKLGEVVDIVGYNQYFGWYYSRMAAKLGLDEGLVREAMMGIMPKIRFSNAFNKPMIISEFGAGAKQGLRSKDALMWSEEYQAKVYKAQLNMLEKSPMVKGVSPWVLQDFRSHLRELNGIQDTYNRKGLVSETGKKKLAFKVLSDYYRELEKKQEAAAH